MIGEVLCGVAEVAIGVSHDGRRDPKKSGKPDYTSGDNLFDCSSRHGREMSLLKAQKDHVMIAEHQDNRTMFLILRRVGNRLEGGVGHVGYCSLGN